MDKVTINKESLKQWQDENLEHLRYEYDLKPGDKCIDIGSYRREWADEMIKRYSVEVECFDALDNKAAWLFDGKLAMGGQYYYTSIYEPATTEYWCVDISPYIQQEIAVCKINIEGGEVDLLNYIIDKDLLKNIRHLQVQFHYVKYRDSEKEYKLLAERISKSHKLDWQYYFCWESWSAL